MNEKLASNDSLKKLLHYIHCSQIFRKHIRKLPHLIAKGNLAEEGEVVSDEDFFWPHY